jgi:hypothetical protein
MTTGLLIVIVSLSALLVTGSILVAVRHFWKLEQELDEGIARLLAEPEPESDAEPPSPRPASSEPNRTSQDSENGGGSA